MLRIGSRLGFQRRARDVTPTPTLAEILQAEPEQREDEEVVNGEES
jgi:hypothetical protein